MIVCTLLEFAIYRYRQTPELSCEMSQNSKRTPQPEIDWGNRHGFFSSYFVCGHCHESWTLFFLSLPFSAAAMSLRSSFGSSISMTFLFILRVEMLLDTWSTAAPLKESRSAFIFGEEAFLNPSYSSLPSSSSPLFATLSTSLETPHSTLFVLHITRRRRRQTWESSWCNLARLLSTSNARLLEQCPCPGFVMHAPPAHSQKPANGHQHRD